MGLGEEKYLRFTTFKRDGTPVSTPVWSIPLGGNEIGFWTSSGSGKAKRLAHTDRVTVQPCNARGNPKPGCAPIEATARLVSGPEMGEIQRKITEKYGLMTKITKALGSIVGAIRRKRIPYGDRGVIVSLPD